jgi:hypothetical protein
MHPVIAGEPRPAPRTPKGTHIVWTTALKDEIVRHYAAGASYREIGTHFAISQTYVAKIGGKHRQHLIQSGTYTSVTGRPVPPFRYEPTGIERKRLC